MNINKVRKDNVRVNNRLPSRCSPIWMAKKSGILVSKRSFLYGFEIAMAKAKHVNNAKKTTHCSGPKTST